MMSGSAPPVFPAAVALLPVAAGMRRSLGVRAVGTALLLLAALSVYAVHAAPALAQTTTFVTNTGETLESTSSSEFAAQAFTTGSHAHGYTLSSVDVVVAANTSTSITTAVVIRTDSSNAPGSVVATLTNPADLRGGGLAGVRTFTAPASTNLTSSTTYWISVNDGISANPTAFARTASDSETAETGWSIANTRVTRASETDSWASQTSSLAIAVKGTERPPPNSPATGVPMIGGIAELGKTLTSSTDYIMDANGLPSNFTDYQWIRVDADGTSNPTDIASATSSTYRLVAEDLNKKLKVRVSFTDDDGYSETLTSDAAPVSGTINSPATGAPTISGTAEVDGTLTAVTTAIVDANGLPSNFTDYQWIRVDADGTSNPTDIASATSDTYTPVAVDVGKKLKVKVSFTDDGGNDETLTSDAYPASGTVNSPATGAPTISGTAEVDGTLTAVTTAIMDANGLPSDFTDYQWIRVDADGTSNPTDIASATSSTYTLVAEDLNKKLKVKVSFTDDGGNDETLTSDAYPASGTVNSPATGQPAISGTAEVDGTLTAVTTAIMDENGLPSNFTDYQWIRVDADGTSNPTDIASATSDTYTPVAVDVGKKLKVKVSFTDDGGNDETLTSDAYPASGTVNSPATGAPTISGTAEVDGTLTAVTTAIMDENGLPSDFTDYQWIRVDADGTSNPTDIASATSSTYTLVAEDLNKKLKVKVSFTDDGGNDETLTSDAYPASGTVNSPATGAPAISGNAEVGEPLTAVTTAIMDENGLPSNFTDYQWIRVDADGTSNPTDIASATSDTYTPVAEDLNKKLKVKVSFTDDGGNDETLTSDAYPASGTVNSPATGAPAISGNAEVGEPLTAVTTAIMDENGLPSDFTDYQWIRVDADGTSNPADIASATSSTYTPVAEDLNKKLKVRVSFTDDGGNDETLTSDAYPVSGTINSPATGAPTISGEAYVFFTLSTLTNEIMDANGLPSDFTDYQWIRVDADGTSNPTDIASATSDTYTLTAADRDKRVKVRVSFTDDGGNDETLTSDAYPASGTVGAFNSPATGEAAMTGIFRVEEALTASTGTIRDADGLTGVSYEYQWIRVDADGTSNPTDIASATSDTYTLVAADVGKKIRVKVSFRDDIGSFEELTSGAYPSVGTIGTATDSEADSEVTNIEVTPVPPSAASYRLRSRDRAAFEALPAGAVHGPGTTLTFTLHFDSVVTVSGTPELVLDVFGRERRARYTGGSGTTQLTFGWTVRRGDYDPDGISVESLALNGATIRNASNREIRLGVFPPPTLRYFGAHRVRGGFFTTRLVVSGSAREGEPFTIRAERDGDFDERAIAMVDVNDSAVTGAQPIAIEFYPRGSRRAGRAVSDGRTGSFTLTPPPDGRVDAGRTMTIRLRDTDGGRVGAEGAVWYDTTGTVEVTVAVADSDLATDVPVLSVGPTSGWEPESGTASLVFRVCLWTSESLCPGEGRSPEFEAYAGVGHEVRVDYATTGDGTATAGSDYLEASGTLIFAPHERVKTVEVEVLSDTIDENSETVWLALTGPVGATIGRGRNFGEIHNHTPGRQTPAVEAGTERGPAPSVSFESVPESHDGESSFTLGVTFSGEPAGLSAQQDAALALEVTGGSVSSARDVTSGTGHSWQVTIAPLGLSDVRVRVPTRSCTDAHAVCIDGRALGQTADTMVLGPPTLSVSDARVQEAAGATLDFVVALSRPLAETVTVSYETADDTATAGADYSTTSGTLTFAANVDTSKTVSVPVLDDAYEEGSETVTFTLSNPSPSRVRLADASAVGTIINVDVMPQAWLARFARTVAEQAVEAVEGRFASPRTARLAGTIGGENVGGLAAGEAGEAADGVAPVDSSAFLLTFAERFDSAEDGDALGRSSFGSRAVTGSGLLAASSFTLIGTDGRGGSVAFWGNGSAARFDGSEGSTTLDGEVITAMIGADWAGERSLAGLMMAHSLGEGGYRSESGGGTLESTLTGLFPYGRYALSERVALWALAGYGEGQLSMTPDGQEPLRPELTLLMGAVGARGVLVESGDTGPTLAMTSDALLLRISSDAVPGLAATDADVTRLRLGLEGALPLRVGASALLTPSAELGVRHDSGDAETGFGADIGAGLTFSEPAYGLSAEIRGRGLLTHEESGMRERGVSGTLTFDPAPESERGVSLSLGQTLGGPSSGGADALLASPTLAVLATEDEEDEEDDLARHRFEARLGYGFGARADRWIVVPELGLGRSDSERELRIGGRLVEAVHVGLAFELGLEATRREPKDGPTGPEHALGLDLGWRLHTLRDDGAALEMHVKATRSEPANDDGPPVTEVGLTAISRW